MQNKLTKQQVDQYIRAAELNLGPGCEEEWVQECTRLLRGCSNVQSKDYFSPEDRINDLKNILTLLGKDICSDSVFAEKVYKALHEDDVRTVTGIATRELKMGEIVSTKDFMPALVVDKKDLDEALNEIKRLEGYLEATMTTNGILLSKLTGVSYFLRHCDILIEALEKISDPRLREHHETEKYTEMGCVMNIANEALDEYRKDQK